MDYRGPGVKIHLTRQQGVRFTGDDDIFRRYGIREIPDTIDLSTFFQSCEVTLPIAGPEGMYQCAVQLAVNYDESIMILNSFIVDFGNQLQITIGYGGPGQDSYKVGPLMFFTHWPSFDYGSQTQFTIKGLSGGSTDLARKKRTTIWSATQLTRAQIIATVASDHRLRVIFGVRPGGDRAGASALRQIPPDLNKRRTADYNQNSKSDQQLLADLCREGGSNYVVENGKMYVYDKDKNREGQPVGTLVFFGQIDTAKNKWPITQFHLEGSMWFRPGGADQQQFRTGIDPKTGRAVTAMNIDSASADIPHDGDNVAAGLAFLNENNTQAFNDPGVEAPEPGLFGGSATQLSYAQAFFNPQTTGDVTPVGSESSSTDGDKQVVRDNAQGAGFKATCTTPGNPILRAGQKINIEGGGRLSGGYLIQKVVHKLDSSGFETELELFRNVTQDQPAKVTSGTAATQIDSGGVTAKRTAPNRVASTDGDGSRTPRTRQVDVSSVRNTAQ